MMTHPVFGFHEENVEYVTRYGVYAVIPDEKKENITMHRHGPIRYHDDLGTGNGCHAVWRREE